MIFQDFTYSPPDPLVLDFDPPISIRDGSLTRLVLKEPSASQVLFAEQRLIASNGNRASRMYQRALVSSNGGVAEPLLDAMPISAFTRAARFLQGFVEASLPSAGGEEADPPPPTLTITFDPPLAVGKNTYPRLVVYEPTLGDMAKADTHLADMSPERVRRFQEAIVTMASRESGSLIAALPISVLNAAASFVMAFSAAGPVTQTS